MTTSGNSFHKLDGPFSVSLTRSSGGSKAFETEASALGPIPSLERFMRSAQETRRFLRSVDDLKRTSTDIAICLLDRGIDWNHPCFRESFVIPRDFTGRGTVADATGHGTKCAALVVGKSARAELGGILPKTRLLVAKVLPASSPESAEKAAVRAVEWAVGAGAKIFVLPFGTMRPTPRLGAALKEAWRAGVVEVAASGNHGPRNLLYPSALPWVWSVTGADTRGRVLPQCTSERLADAVAPGQVLSASAWSPDEVFEGSSPAAVLFACIAAFLTGTRQEEGSGLEGA